MELHCVQAILDHKEALEVQQRDQAIIKDPEEAFGSRILQGRKKCVTARQYLKRFKPPQGIQGLSTHLPEGEDEAKEDSPGSSASGNYPSVVPMDRSAYVSP